MDFTTRLAIRAVIRALGQSPAIDEEDLRLIMDELSKAADAERYLNNGDVAAELLHFSLSTFRAALSAR